MKHKRATQDDVAQLAGVTRATVSYVLTGRAVGLKITPAVIERVKEASRKLRYVPNLAARSLAAGRSRQIGLLLPAPGFLNNHYWGPIAAGVERAALRAGYDVLLLASHEDIYQTAENYLNQNRVDIIIALGLESETLLNRLPMPPVIIGAPRATCKVPLVHSGIDHAVAGIFDSLQASDVSQVAWLGPISGLHPSTQDRLAAVRKECSQRRIHLKAFELPSSPVGLRLDGEKSINHWYELIKKSAKLPDGTRALLCWNDMVALGSYLWLSDLNLQPGRDVAVTGFDDYFAETALPSLSTVSLESETLGEEAVKLALEILGSESRRAPFPQVTVPARFVARNSTALAKR